MQSILLALFVTAYPTVNNQALTLPLKDNATINAGFHQKRGKRRIHGAIDQNTPIGTPVRAVADGTVTNIYSMRSYMRASKKILRRLRLKTGRSWRSIKRSFRRCRCTRRIRRYSRGAWKSGVYITVEHISDNNKTFISQYMHLSKTFVKIGAKVKRGDIIAKSGDTAIINSSPHLHFQIKHKGIKQDPKKYIKELNRPLLTTLKRIPPNFFWYFTLAQYLV